MEKGQTLGIIGQNGSGKSTLLQILAGIMRQTRGDCHVDGKVSALLELGSGFNPEFTGRENVFMNGAILGLTRRQMQERFDAIARFAEIGDFMEQPVKTYSSGMFMRLAFAVAVNVDPDILLVDEALAVGDLIFQHRCMHRMNQLRAAGKTTVLVTHDLAAVTKFCDRALLLDGGRLLEDGAARQGRAEVPGPDLRARAPLRADSAAREARRRRATCSPPGEEMPIVALDPEHRSPVRQRRPARILGVELLDEQGSPTREVLGGQSVMVRISVEFLRGCGPAHPRLHPARPARRRNFRLQHQLRGSALPAARKGQIYTSDFEIRMPRMARAAATPFAPAVAEGDLLSTTCATGSTMP